MMFLVIGTYLVIGAIVVTLAFSDLHRARTRTVEVKRDETRNRTPRKR